MSSAIKRISGKISIHVTLRLVARAWQAPRKKEEAGTIVEDVSMTVTIRYWRKASEIGSTTHRIVFRDEIYDITNVDHMNFKKKSLKFSCRKVRR